MTGTQTHAATEVREGPNPYIALVIVLAAVFVQLVDISIVNVAVPSIQNELHASYASIQLVLAGYQLGFACTLITGARLGDIFGRKRLFMIGMVGFTAASAACGAAPTATFLVAARIVQGVFSGLMFPQVLSVIQVAFPPRERGKAFGIFGATIGLATILGPLLGGALIALNLGGLDWRLIFYVNLPIGVAALIGATRALAESRAPDAPRLDVPGALLSAAGFFLLVYPLTTGREHHWPLWIYALLIASVPVLGYFAFYEVKRTRAKASPLVDTSLFGDRAFRVGGLLSLVFFGGVAPFFFTFSIYLQIGQGYSALGAGLTTFPFAIGSAVASSQSDKLAQRFGNKVLLAGCGLLVIGNLAIIGVASLAKTHVHSYYYSGVFLVAGIGLGLFVAPVINVILSEVRTQLAGPASGVLSSVQQIGGAIGVAVIGVIFFGLIGANADSSARPTIPQLRTQLAAAQLPPAAQQQAITRFTSCFDKRSRATDPAAHIDGCPDPRAAAKTPTDRAFAAAAREAQKGTFSRSIQETLFYEVGIFALAGFLVTRLPKSAPTAVPAEPVVAGA